MRGLQEGAGRDEHPHPPNAAPTPHRLRDNRLQDEGVITVCDALRKSNVSKVQELDLSNNRIGLPGAESVAAYMAVSGGLTSVRHI